MDLLSLKSELKRAEKAVTITTESAKASKLAVAVAENKIYMATHGDNQLGGKALLRLKKDKDKELAKRTSCLRAKAEAQKKVASLREDIRQHALEACVPKDAS